MCFFCVEGLRPAMKGTSCVRRVPLRSFHRRISSPLASCNVWLFMCAYFYALVVSVVADRNVMIASRLLGAAAAFFLFTIVFCSSNCESYWNGCYQAAIVICQQMFAILPLAIFLLKLILKSASKSFFFGMASR